MKLKKIYDKLKELGLMKNNIQEIKYNSDPKNPINKRIKYIGEVVNGVPEGKGIIYWKDGERYEGKWKNVERDGKVINFWPEGDRYEGKWKKNKNDGKRYLLLGKLRFLYW